MDLTSTDKNRSYLSAVIMPLAALVVVMIVSAIAGVFWIAEYQTDRAIAQEARLAAGGLRVHGEKLASNASDYSYWDDAVTAIIDTPDPEWIRSNIGDGAEESLGAHMAFVLDPSGRPLYSRILGVDGLEDPTALFRHGFKEAFLAWKKRDAGSLYSGAVSYKNGAALIAIAPVRSWTDNKRPITGHSLVIVRIVDEALLKQMARDYELNASRQVHGVEASLDHRASVPITDEDGHSITHLFWTPARPGDKLIEIALPFLAVFLVALTALATFVLRHAMASARVISDSTARANSDALTGLSNRRLFMRKLQAGIDAIAPGRNELALFYIDLDGFKNVNDTLGHLAGDELLQQVASRLVNCAGENACVARLGGDEFAICINHRSGRHILEMLARGILRELYQPFSLSAGTVRISASIGIACSTDRHHRLALLVECADSALYKAKAAGKNRYILSEAADEPAVRSAA